MNAPVDTSAITATITGIVPLVTLGAQWVKQYSWFRNKWIPTVAPAAGAILAIGGLFTSGVIDLTTFAVHDWFNAYNAVLGGMAGGVTAVVGYGVQKQLGQRVGITLLPPGPDDPPSPAEVLVKPSKSVPTEGG